MIRKDGSVDWMSPMKKQFDTFMSLNALLAVPPMLALPKIGRPYLVTFDARAYVVGTVLLQQEKEENPKEWATPRYWSKC